MTQHKIIRVVEQAGVSASSFPVSFELDTARLIGEGKMRPDGAGIRIALTGTEIPYQVEGINTENTMITFQIDLKPGESRDDIVLYFGKDLKPAPDYDKSWGTVRSTMDGFENGLLRISYGVKTGTYGKEWGCQNEFTIKSVNEDQFGGSTVPQSWAKSRNDVTYWKENIPARFQEIEADGPIYKRIRFFTDEVISDDHGILKNLSQRVTFYRNCPFIKEEYENIKGAVVDVVTPGGMPLRTANETTEPQRHGEMKTSLSPPCLRVSVVHSDSCKRNFDYVAFNFGSKLITWSGIGDDHETRGGWDAGRPRTQKDPRYCYLDDYVYSGHFMMGVVNVHNGRGLASCALAENIRTCYFVDWPHERAGYSLWPRKDGKMNRYFYYVENGEDEAISRGRLLANPPSSMVIDSYTSFSIMDGTR